MLWVYFGFFLFKTLRRVVAVWPCVYLPHMRALFPKVGYVILLNKKNTACCLSAEYVLGELCLNMIM